jgi:transcription termination factor NusB
MKIEIEKSEYDRLKSREEKLMAYYEWFVDKENDLATVEDIITENIKLKEENKKLKENWSIEIKICNRYREKCEEYGKEITQLKIDLSNAEMSARCWEKVAN